jgi:hypothetical protein
MSSITGATPSSRKTGKDINETKRIVEKPRKRIKPKEDWRFCAKAQKHTRRRMGLTAFAAALKAIPVGIAPGHGKGLMHQTKAIRQTALPMGILARG